MSRAGAEERISRDLWDELRGTIEERFKDRPEPVYAFEPFETPLPPAPKPEEPPAPVPNAQIAEDAVDPAVSFQKFVGKRLDLRERVPGEEEVMHGWEKALRESFAERLARLRREVPETIQAIETLRAKEAPVPTAPGLGTLKHVSEANAGLGEHTKHVRQELLNLVLGLRASPLGEAPRATENLNVWSPVSSSMTEIPLSLLLAAARAWQNESATLQLQSPVCLQQAASEVAAMRVQRLQQKLDAILHRVKGDQQLDGTLACSLAELLTFTEGLRGEHETLMQSKLRVLQTNLELLEGVPPRPDDPGYRSPYESEILAILKDEWCPKKKIDKMTTLIAEISVHATALLPSVAATLKQQKTQHNAAGELLQRLRACGTLYASLITTVHGIDAQFDELEKTASQHRQRLTGIFEQLRPSQDLKRKPAPGEPQTAATATTT